MARTQPLYALYDHNRERWLDTGTMSELKRRHSQIRETARRNRMLRDATSGEALAEKVQTLHLIDDGIGGFDE